MTPAILIRQIWTTRRGVGGLMVALALVGLLLYATWVNMGGHRAVVALYGSAVIAPLDDTLCPGDDLRYPADVTVTEEHLPVSHEVTEGWFSIDRGFVLSDTVKKPLPLPLLQPTHVEMIAHRTVPNVPPGRYWFNHLSENGERTAYMVGPVTVLDPSFCGE